MATALLESPKLDTVLQVWPHQTWVMGKDHLPSPDGNIHTAPRYHQPSLLQGTELAQLTRTATAFSAKLLSSWAVPSIHWCCLGFFPSDAGLGTPPCRSCQSISPGCWGPYEWQHDSLWCTSQSIQFCKIDKSAPSPKSLMKCSIRLVPVLAPGYTTSCQTSARLWTTDYHSVDMAFQPCFYLTVCSPSPYFISFSMRILLEAVPKALLKAR